jgi:hypothetical protein
LNWLKKAVRYEDTWEVRRDGKLLFRGPSESECWGWLQRHTSYSVDWAMKYEGYTITKSGTDWQDSYQWFAPEGT